jgi:hypothetical protein
LTRLSRRDEIKEIRFWGKNRIWSREFGEKIGFPAATRLKKKSDFGEKIGLGAAILEKIGLGAGSFGKIGFSAA